MTSYPNARNNPAGAIPVYMAPSNPKAMPIIIMAGATGPASGPIPIRIVAGPTGPGGTDQGVDANAIPVVESGAANAMPVWVAGGVAPGPVPENTTPPSITPSGVVLNGALLTANPGVWTNNPTGYIYQWTRNGGNIGGANLPTYTTVVADRNTVISVMEVAQNANGDSAPVNSSNTVSVMGVPVNIIPPSIAPAGSVVSGTGLTINPGTWTNNPTSYFYSWRRDGAAIGGANMNVYLTTTADEGTVIDGVILAQNAAGGGVGTPTSNQVSVTP